MVYGRRLPEADLDWLGILSNMVCTLKLKQSLAGLNMNRSERGMANLSMPEECFAVVKMFCNLQQNTYAAP